MSSTSSKISILLVLLSCLFQTCSAQYYSSWWSMWYLWVVIIIVLSCCGGCIGHYRRQKMLKRAGVGRGQVFVVQAQHGQIMQNQYMTTPPPPGAYPQQQQYPQGNFNPGFMPMPEPTMKPPSYEDAVTNQVPPPATAPQGNAPPTATDLPSSPPPYQS